MEGVQVPMHLQKIGPSVILVIFATLSKFLAFAYNVYTLYLI